MKAKSTADYVKLGLIPLLLGVLYCVIPRDNKETAATESSQQSAAKSNATAPREVQRTSTQVDITSLSAWPAFRSDDFADMDPFDRRMIVPEVLEPTVSNESSISDHEILVSNLARPEREPLKIQAVFESPKGIVALVDDRVIQVGDQLEDGSKVIEITRDQIVVARTGIE